MVYEYVKGCEKMYYQIAKITEEDGWIFIDANGWGTTAIRALAEAYTQEIGGTLVQPYEGDAQYMVKGAPYKLMFQYDDLFGNVVILNDIADKDKVVALLQDLFIKLKNVN